MSLPPDHASPEQAASGFVRALSRDWLPYFATYGLGAIGNLAVVPIQVGALGLAEFGLFALIESVLVLAITAAQMGLKFAYLQRVADAPAERDLLFGTSLLTGFGLALLVAVPLGCAGLLFPTLPQPAIAVPLLALSLVASNLNIAVTTELRSLRQAGRLAIFAVFHSLALIGLTAGFLEGLGWGIAGAILAATLASLLQTGLLAILVLRHLRPRFALDLIMPMVRYGAPMTGGLLVRYGLETAARALAIALLSQEAAAHLALAHKTALLIDHFLANPFFMAWGALQFPALNHRYRAEIVAAVLEVTILAGAAAAGFLIAGAIPALHWMAKGAAIDPALACLPILVVMRVAILVQSPLAAGRVMTRNTLWQLHFAGLALILYLILGPGLMLGFGLPGAAWANGITQLLILAGIGWGSVRLLPLSIPWQGISLAPLLLALPVIPAGRLQSVAATLLAITALVCLARRLVQVNRVKAPG